MAERRMRPVDDKERMHMVRTHITKAAEIVEAMKVAYEDEITLVPRNVIRELEECLMHLNSAHVDAYVQMEQAFPGIDDK